MLEFKIKDIISNNPLNISGVGEYKNYKMEDTGRKKKWVRKRSVI